MTLKIGQMVVTTSKNTRVISYSGKEIEGPIFYVRAAIKVRIDGGEAIFVRVASVGVTKEVSVWAHEEGFSPACCTKSENDFL